MLSLSCRNKDMENTTIKFYEINLTMEKGKGREVGSSRKRRWKGEEKRQK